MSAPNRPTIFSDMYLAAMEEDLDLDPFTDPMAIVDHMMARIDPAEHERVLRTILSQWLALGLDAHNEEHTK